MLRDDLIEYSLNSHHSEEAGKKIRKKIFYLEFEIENFNYKINEDFLPLNFLNNIDTESKLRNQFMALQKSNQSVYVPEFTSSLYENKYEYKKDYTPTTCKTTVKCSIDLSNNTFNNFTRYNLRK